MPGTGRTGVSLHSLGTTGPAGHRPFSAVQECRLQAGPYRCVVWTYGATLVELWVPDRAGRSDNVVLRLPRLADYEQRADDARLGSTMGRFCRVIAGGRLVLDGRSYQLDRNAGQHHLHGGSEGFDRRVWDIANTAADDAGAQVSLRLLSENGDQGYPGDLEVHTTYRLGLDASLTVTHEATSSASTVVGLTTHGYWNLAGGGQIDKHELRIAAARVIAHDDQLLPLDLPEPVAGTALDYTDWRPIGSARVDNCFLPDGRQPVVELRDPASGRQLSMETCQPGLAVYTADDFRRRTRGGVCLQSTALPDAVNHPAFPSARLDPGSVYRHETVYRFQGG